MDKPNRYLKIIMILIITLGFSGCSSMNVSMDSLKYGKLYTMLEALEDAGQNCSNEEIRLRAVEWAVIGYHDLNNSRDYMDRKSTQYLDTRSMMRSLSSITARRNDNIEKLCNDIQLVGEVTREYLASMDNHQLIVDEPVKLAIVQY